MSVLYPFHLTYYERFFFKLLETSQYRRSFRLGYYKDHADPEVESSSHIVFRHPAKFLNERKEGRTIPGIPIHGNPESLRDHSSGVPDNPAAGDVRHPMDKVHREQHSDGSKIRAMNSKKRIADSRL